MLKQSVSASCLLRYLLLIIDWLLIINWSYNFGIGFGLIVLVLVLTFWSCFHHWYKAVYSLVINTITVGLLTTDGADLYATEVCSAVNVIHQTSPHLSSSNCFLCFILWLSTFFSRVSSNPHFLFKHFLTTRRTHLLPEALWSFSVAAPQDSVRSQASCSSCWSPPLSYIHRQNGVCLKPVASHSNKSLFNKVQNKKAKNIWI